MDDDQDRKQILDEMLSASPEEVLALLQNDLRYFVETIESGLFLLSEPESQEEHDLTVERLKQNTKSLRDQLDLILDYLKMRRD